MSIKCQLLQLGFPLWWGIIIGIAGESVVKGRTLKVEQSSCLLFAFTGWQEHILLLELKILEQTLL